MTFDSKTAKEVLKKIRATTRVLERAIDSGDAPDFLFGWRDPHSGHDGIASRVGISQPGMAEGLVLDILTELSQCACEACRMRFARALEALGQVRPHSHLTN